MTKSMLPAPNGDAAPLATLAFAAADVRRMQLTTAPLVSTPLRRELDTFEEPPEWTGFGPRCSLARPIAAGARLQPDAVGIAERFELQGGARLLGHASIVRKLNAVARAAPGNAARQLLNPATRELMVRLAAQQGALMVMPASGSRLLFRSPSTKQALGPTLAEQQLELEGLQMATLAVRHGLIRSSLPKEIPEADPSPFSLGLIAPYAGGDLLARWQLLRARGRRSPSRAATPPAAQGLQAAVGLTLAGQHADAVARGLPGSPPPATDSETMRRLVAKYADETAQLRELGQRYGILLRFANVAGFGPNASLLHANRRPVQLLVDTPATRALFRVENEAHARRVLDAYHLDLDLRLTYTSKQGGRLVRRPPPTLSGFAAAKA